MEFKDVYWDSIMNKLTTHSIVEGLRLIGVNVKYRCFQAYDFFTTVLRYYSNTLFMKADISLMLMYLFDNPYSVSKRFLIRQGEKNVYDYGETPLPTLEKISKVCGITPSDHVFEMGCGSGRTCFWLRAFCKCAVTGIDVVDEFILRAERIRKKLNIDNISFINQDYTLADLDKATVIYLYGTTLGELKIFELSKKFESLPRGTRVITVSYPLTDYVEEGQFELMKRFDATFPWGEADVFLQIKK